MRTFAASAAAAAVVAIAACSGGMSAADEPAPWSPAGTYNFTTTVQGMTVGGTMTVTDTDGVLGGIIEPDPAAGVPPIPFETAELAGNELTVTADAGGEVLFMVLTFAEDDSFDGSWSMAGDGGDVTGTKVGS